MRASCRQSGAIEHPYPLGRYRFDWHIDTGITKDPVDNLLAGVQWLLAMAWTVLLYALSAVLLAFQWAFSLDLLGEAMTPARRGLPIASRLRTRIPVVTTGFPDAPERIRTSDLRFRRPTLYPAELRALAHARPVMVAARRRAAARRIRLRP